MFEKRVSVFGRKTEKVTVVWTELRKELFAKYYNDNQIDPLKTKRRPLYLKTQSVPLCKHFSTGL